MIRVVPCGRTDTDRHDEANSDFSFTILWTRLKTGRKPQPWLILRLYSGIRWGRRKSHNNKQIGQPVSVVETWTGKNSEQKLEMFLYSINQQCTKPLYYINSYYTILCCNMFRRFSVSSSGELNVFLAKITWMSSVVTECYTAKTHQIYKYKAKEKAIPLQASTGPEGSRRLSLPDFKTIGTWRW